MIVKSKLKPETRIQLLIALGSLASLALVLSIFLGRTGNSDLDFVTGFLDGLSITGNLGYILVVTRYLYKNRRQK